MSEPLFAELEGEILGAELIERLQALAALTDVDATPVDWEEEDVPDVWDLDRGEEQEEEEIEEDEVYVLDVREVDELINDVESAPADEIDPRVKQAFEDLEDLLESDEARQLLGGDRVAVPRSKLDRLLNRLLDLSLAGPPVAGELDENGSDAAAAEPVADQSAPGETGDPSFSSRADD